jgi:hypothetical protein
LDKSGANKAAMDAINASCEIPIIVRQVKCFNKFVEQVILPLFSVLLKPPLCGMALTLAPSRDHAA